MDEVTWAQGEVVIGWFDWSGDWSGDGGVMESRAVRSHDEGLQL